MYMRIHMSFIGGICEDFASHARVDYGLHVQVRGHIALISVQRVYSLFELSNTGMDSIEPHR